MATTLDGFKLEVAFSSGPFDASPTWTDITAYWVQSQSSTITRGRTSELDSVATGTLQITLDNTDGRFTVGNTSSPYYPNVKLRKQIRVTYTESAVTYPRFKGHVDEWPVQWPTGGETYAWAQVRASDRFKALGSVRALRSVPEEEVLLSVPQLYWTLGDDTGSTQAGEISGNSASVLSIKQYGVGGAIDFGTGIGASTDGFAAPQFTFGAADGSSGKALATAATTTIGSTTGLSVEFAASSTQTTYTNWPLQVGMPYRASASFVLACDTTGITLTVADSAGNTEVDTAAVSSLIDGSTHHYGITVTPNVSGAVFRIYVDGSMVLTHTMALAAWKSATLPAITGLQVGGLYVAVTPAFFGFQGTMSHVATYTTILDATAMARHYNAMKTGFANESTGARIGRVADWCNIATGDRSIDTGSTTSIRHVDTTGKTALGFLQEIADTEAGLIFMGKDGKLNFQSRSDRINTTAALTLNASSQQVSPDVQYRSNDQFLSNDVTYFRDGGITYRVTDATSITDYGNADRGQSPSGGHETYTTSDNEVRDHATWVVYTGKTPTPRIEALGVDLLTDSTSRINALGLDLSSKVTVTNMPTAAPGASTSVFVEGYTETISTSGWDLSLNTSPADLYSPLWQLGVAGFSELGVTTVLNF